MVINYQPSYLAFVKTNIHIISELMWKIEKWENTLDEDKQVSPVFMDLSKAFDTINHDLLIDKFGTYGFSGNALLFMLSYVRNGSQRVSINSSLITLEETIAGVPQGALVRSLLLSIFLNYIFYFENISFLSNYADLNLWL